MPNAQLAGGEAIHSARIYFADYLRAALVCLVILHHTAITYGGSGSFYYTEAATDSIASGLLTLFTNFNQAWFMGLFFLLSGYFSPGSLDRKGPKKFLKDRLIRLGIPFLVFYFVLNPITVFVAFSHLPVSQVVAAGFTFPLTVSWQSYLNSVGNGPLWFVEMLFIFELGYVVWRVATRNRARKVREFPSYRKVTAFILVLAASAYLLRIVIPADAQVLGFPSLFDLPQYLSFFIVGVAAARGGWLTKMPSSMARRFFIIALIASGTLLILAVIGTEDSSLGWGSAIGYGSFSSTLYALWDSTFAVGMSMFAISFFRSHFNSPGKLWKFSSQHFYTAYILQATVIVVIAAIVLSSLHTESLLKFGLASLIILPLTWGLAYLVRRIPFADKVL